MLTPYHNGVYVASLCASPAWRGKGLGSQLLYESQTLTLSGYRCLGGLFTETSASSDGVVGLRSYRLLKPVTPADVGRNIIVERQQLRPSSAGHRVRLVAGLGLLAGMARFAAARRNFFPKAYQERRFFLYRTKAPLLCFAPVEAWLLGAFGSRDGRESWRKGNCGLG